MEAFGTFRCVQELWQAKEAYVATFVMDDDSSCRAILQHGIQALRDAGRITEEEAAKTVATDDKGILPLEHPPLNFKGDKNHRIRNYAKKLFDWARANNLVSKCQSGDAERLKRNFSYLLHQRSKIKQSFCRFQRDAKACLQHHFNDHHFCGKWCSVRRLQKKEQLRRMLRFRSLVKDKEMHDQVKPHHEAFTSKKALLEVWHGYHSNKCELLNNMITKFVPKKKHMCRTLSNKARTHMAIGLDSVGYEEYFRRLFELLGVQLVQTTTNHHLDLDKTRLRKRKWRQRPEFKIEEAEKNIVKILAAKEQAKRDAIKGFTYGSGMAGPKAPEEETKDELPANPKKKTASICPFCEQKGHKTMAAKSCLFSTKIGSPNYKEDNEERGIGKL
jgi:hypothetical protein